MADNEFKYVDPLEWEKRPAPPKLDTATPDGSSPDTRTVTIDKTSSQKAFFRNAIFVSLGLLSINWLIRLGIMPIGFLSLPYVGWVFFGLMILAGFGLPFAIIGYLVTLFRKPKIITVTLPQIDGQPNTADGSNVSELNEYLVRLQVRDSFYTKILLGSLVFFVLIFGLAVSAGPAGIGPAFLAIFMAIAILVGMMLWSVQCVRATFKIRRLGGSMLTKHKVVLGLGALSWLVAIGFMLP